MGTRVAALFVVGALALSGCSGDDDGDGGGNAPRTDEATTIDPSSTPEATCADSFNADAPVDFARLVRLSHAPAAAILTGTYAGEEFTAPTYGTSADDPPGEGTVAPGACVVTEQSNAGAALYVFAVGSDDAWHWFLESDPAVPLSRDPAGQLADVVPVTLDDSGQRPLLTPGG